MRIQDKEVIDMMVMFTLAKLAWLNVKVVEEGMRVTLTDIETDLDEYSRNQIQSSLNRLGKAELVWKNRVGRSNRFALNFAGRKKLIGFIFFVN